VPSCICKPPESVPSLSTFRRERTRIFTLVGILCYDSHPHQSDTLLRQSDVPVRYTSQMYLSDTLLRQADVPVRYTVTTVILIRQIHCWDTQMYLSDTLLRQADVPVRYTVKTHPRTYQIHCSYSVFHRWPVRYTVETVIIQAIRYAVSTVSLSSQIHC
jgi:hypothetical protein